jgi:Zn-dependent protease with chaperone function
MQATYFDGRSAAARPVTIDITDGRLRLSGDGIALDVPLAAMVITDRLGHTARQLRFPDGGFCEVEDSDELERVLNAQGAGSSAVGRWERSGRLAIAAVAVLAVAAFLAYRYGLPVLADSVARNLPVSAVNAISDNAVKVLDSLVFAPSEIPRERQNQIRFAFGRLRLPGRDGPQTEQIEFRRSDALGPNALALPSGRIIVTDALVTLATDDRELLGVLAHEA